MFQIQAANLRRLMARLDLTVEGVVEQTGLDQRTVRGILKGRGVPHARTLHKLAAGLGVSIDELFQHPALLGERSFDRRTNPRVDELVTARPALFTDWTEVDFEELYSRFGTGGQLTAEGTLASVEAMNRNHDTQNKVALVLESGEAELLRQIVETLYRRIAVSE